MFAKGGGREIKTPSGPDGISTLINSVVENVETKSRTVRMVGAAGGAVAVCIGTAGAGCVPAARLATGFIKDEMSAANDQRTREKGVSTATTGDRRAAVRDAWRLEADAVRNGGTGSRNWTPAERQELIKTGKVSGYEGHHINGVNKYPQHARDPNNIKFVKGRQGHLKEHKGNFRNPTKGPMIRRK